MEQMRLLLCTGNPGKVLELRAMLPKHVELISLQAVGLPIDLPENGDTLEANAREKAHYAFERTGLLCLADDTGLEVTYLKGAPGVRSARYAGEEKDPKANMQLLLSDMEGTEDRSARFRTVLVLVGPDLEMVFEGVVDGTLTKAPRGSGGFGYDPLFVPAGSDLTFAEMDVQTKNKLSHRARAVERFAAWVASNGWLR
jgi:XTP/dITP diphosphohydrolase